MATSVVDLIANRRNPTQLSNLVFDATLSITHVYDNQKTSYAVEDGGDITDNVRLLPERVTIEGHFTNHPIRILNGQIPDEGNRVDLAHTELLKLAGREVPKQPGDPLARNTTPAIIDVITGLRIYTSMMITNLTVNENPKSRNALSFTITLEPFEIVFTELSVVNNSSSFVDKAVHIENQSQEKVNTGVNKTAEVKPNSVLKNITDDIKSLFTPDSQPTQSPGAQ